MTTWTYDKPPTYFPNAAATTQGWVNPVTGEVLVAIKNLTTKRTDALAVPTFTLLAPTARAYVAGDTLTFSLISNEQVHVRGTPTIDITMGSKTTQLVYDVDASVNGGGTNHKFSYKIVAGDTAASGALVVANKVSLTKVGTGKNAITDRILGGGGEAIAANSLSYTAPATTGIVIAG